MMVVMMTADAELMAIKEVAGRFKKSSILIQKLSYLLAAFPT